MSSTVQRRHVSTPAILMTLVGLLMAIIAVELALHTTVGQRIDDWALGTAYAGPDARLSLLSVLGNVSIGAIVAVMLGCVAVALMRRRVALAVGAVVIMVGANVTTQLLKHHILERPDLGFGTLNSLPSGHTTVVASAVGATLLVIPSLFRTVAVAAGAFAVSLTATSTVVAGWHRPGDLVAAMAISLAWTAAVTAVVGRRASHQGVGTYVLSFAGSIFALIFLISVGVRPTQGWDGFVQASLVLGFVAATASIAVAFMAEVTPEE